MSIESNRNDLERVKHELHEINVRDIGSADPIFTFDPDAEIDSDDEIDNEKTINVYLNDLMTRIFPELEGLDPELLSRIREKIDKAVHATGQANITEIFDMLKHDFFEDPIYINPIRPQELKLTTWQESLRSRILGDSGVVPITPIDYRTADESDFSESKYSPTLDGGSEYANYEYTDRAEMNWDPYAEYPYHDIDRGDAVRKDSDSLIQNSPTSRPTLLDTMRSSIQSKLHSNRVMFTINKSAGVEKIVKTKTVFGTDTPQDFWIVTSFVIPSEYANDDWWLVSIEDSDGNIQEGLKIMGSQKRIVYAASSPKGPQKQQIVGAAENGWDNIFDGNRHQIAVHVSPRRIQFYHNCDKKGGNFLSQPRHLNENLNLKLVKTIGGKSVPILFDNLEMKDDNQANEEGICCPNINEPQLFKCIIEGINGFQQLPINLPPVLPVLEKCEKGIQGYQGEVGMKGTAGLAGAQGVQGRQGDRGEDCQKGTVGPVGIPGSNGSVGKKGQSGINGEKGEQGRPGAIGRPGIKGDNGAPGKTGPSGHPGIDGINGYTGSPGANGKPGTPGINGLQGPQGIIGPKGDVGSPGEPGIPGSSHTGAYGVPGVQGNPGKTGDKGATGPMGNAGQIGVPGNSGIIGLPGADGIMGNPGAAGSNGSSGPQGFPGIKGDEGEPGKPGKTGKRGNAGQPGPVGPKGSRGIDGQDGFDGNMGEAGETGVPGPVGPVGVKGNKGPIGFTGSRGLQGNDGARGFTGESGPATTEAELKRMIREVFEEIVPRMIEPVRQECKKCSECRESNLHFRKKMSSVGPPGAKGDSGRQGRPGVEGLKGLPGVPGEPGKQGLSGETGQRGPAGERGRDIIGAPGTPGIEGPLGLPGDCTPGKPGQKGQKGDPGPLGRNGPVGLPGPLGVCDNSDCTAPESWANQLQKYADQVFRKPVAPYSKGPTPPRSASPASQPDDISRRLPEAPENSIIGPPRPAETMGGSLGIPDELIPHLKGPTGQRHTINLNYIEKPPPKPTTTTTTTTAITTTTTSEPKKAKPAKTNVPVINTRKCSKCAQKCSKTKTNPNCRPSPCRSSPTICSARKQCPIRPTNKRKHCVVRRIQVMRHKRMQEILRQKRKDITRSQKKRSAKKLKQLNHHPLSQ